MIEGRDKRMTLYKQKSRQILSPSKYENHSEQKDSRRKSEAEYDDGDEGEE